MRYSDENQQGLLSLLAASQAGLDPTTAYGIMQDIQAEQQMQNQMRMERQQGLIGMLQELAMSGMPAGASRAALEAAPGPFGPALQNAMQAIYPQGEPAPGPDLNYLGNEMDGPVGSAPPAAAPSGPPTTGPQRLSPLYQQTPMAGMTPLEQQQYALNDLQMQQAMAEQEDTARADAAASASAVAGFQQAAAQAKASGKTVDEFMIDVMSIPENAIYLQQNQAALGDILRATWDPEEVAYSSWHSKLAGTPPQGPG